MEPFYFLKCEHQDNRPRATTRWQTGGDQDPARSSCTLRVYGKNEKGETVAVELLNYLPAFYVSFRDKSTCVRIVNGLIKHIRDLGELGRGDMSRLAAAAAAAVTSSSPANPRRFGYIKGMENVTGYSSLIIDKDHQDRNASAAASSSGSEYGDTSLSFTFRVFVRCFAHVRLAIREILDTADEMLRPGESGRSGWRNRDVRFYQSSLEPDVLIAETLKLRPCQWTLFDRSVCTRTTFTSPYECLRSSVLDGVAPCHTYSYDFEKYILQETRVSGRLVYEKIPFACKAEECETPTPPPPPPPPPPAVSVLSFDIECLANDVNVFPTPDVCAVIQIATVFERDALNRHHDDRSWRHRCLYTVRDCEPLYGTGDGKNSSDEDSSVVTRCFDDERDMLASFCADLAAADPDIVTGYYIENFDLPFLFARFQHHGLTPAFGRLGLVSTCVKNDRRSNENGKKYTSHVIKSHFTTIHGRTVFDACVYARKEFTMRSYTLNAVAERFLGVRKDDVHYTQIPSLFLSGPQGRAVLGRYCVKDAQLVIDLLFNWRAFINMFERCKVFNTMLCFLLDRGQQVRIASMLLKWCSARAILIDDRTVVYRSDDDVVHNAAASVAAAAVVTVEREEREDGNSDSESVAAAAAVQDGGGKMKHTRYDGAVVIEPKTGLYHDPVVCLDYASLYPSIMIAYNLCYTTMITNTKHGADLAALGDAERSPVGHYFLKTETKKGVLPSILETLISTRSAVRASMAGLDKTSMDYTLLDGQQSALKIAANSVYGATGSQEGKLFFLHIPSSVTAYGRELITTTKRYVESAYTDREVVYGDTDSVMVRMVGWTKRSSAHHQHHNLWECADAGDEMAAAVTRLIDRPPIRLQFETVYMPFLLASKKRYAAGIYKSLDRVRSVARTEGVDAAAIALHSASRDVCCKGLEVVRRDNCMYAKNTMQRAVDMIINMEPIERVVNEMRDCLARLLRGEVNVRDLIVSKEWSKKTKNPTPHDHLAQKMAVRNPGEAPHIGDRIQYVVIAQNEREPPRKLFERAEDPLYALERGLTLDYVYYANNQLLNPLTNLLAVAMPEHCDKEQIKDMLWPKVVATDGRTIERPNKRQAVGAPKRPRRNTKFDKSPPNNAKITSFIQRRSVEKKIPLSRPDATGGTTYSATTGDTVLKDIEDICSNLVTECMACKAGAVERVVTCKNRECSTLYVRYEQKSKIREFALGDRIKSDIRQVLGF